MRNNHSEVKVDLAEAVKILESKYNLEGKLIPLNGEMDYNFRLQTSNKNYLLKISRLNSVLSYLEFQTDLLNYLSSNKIDIISPKALPDINGNYIAKISDSRDNTRFARLLSWIDGRLYSTVNPQNDELLYSLGREAGNITSNLIGFDHTLAHRQFEWDNAQVEWITNYIHLFNEGEKNVITYFLNLLRSKKELYESLRKSVVHNDVNDNNIIVSSDLQNPKVVAIIDYGDAIYTQIINDLAICIAYGAMNKADLLSASCKIIRGYDYNFPLEEKELELLYTLVGIRLIISVAKSAINKEKDPNNKYLQISDKPAWELLYRWYNLNEKLAIYSFRDACGFIASLYEKLFNTYASNIKITVNDLFPNVPNKHLCLVDMSVSSKFIGNESEYNNNNLLTLKLKRLQLENPNSIITGGYLETRPLYITDAYKREGNNGPEYRCVHLGVDFWLEPKTALHSLLDGTVFSIHDNSNDKDYGPTIILEHVVSNELTFYTLYGHLSKSSLSVLEIGKLISKGDLIGYIGNSNENGNWAPHLHFQVILDLFGNKTDFPGVAYSNELGAWSSICPDPNLLFKNPTIDKFYNNKSSSIISERKRYLGQGLSISYNNPLHIIRGQGQYLIDINGRKYLDTVNNVAHVGHEHPEVVKTAQDQIAILNTNTRYLHENINKFAKELLSTFPKELSVVHFVNSGSEANELALRMARTYTNQKDMIAVEVGYHGNTSGCVDVSSYKFDGKGGMGAPEFTHIVPLPDSYRGIYQGDNCGQSYAEHISDYLMNIKSKGRNIAGFICESIISCGGQIELPRHYLELAYKIVREAGGVCISDEVQVGCGRVGGKFWGFELHNVIPDIVTIGKPLGNGHPVAAVVCTKEIANAFNNGMEYFNTFGGNPVSCAIGKTVLEVIKKEDLQKNALTIGNYLKAELRNLQSKYPIIGNVRGQGFFLGFELVDENKNPENEKANYLINRMRELGILMSTDGKDNNVIKIKPPMVFSKENADGLLFRLKQVMKEDFMRPINE